MECFKLSVPANFVSYEPTFFTTRVPGQPSVLKTLKKARPKCHNNTMYRNGISTSSFKNPPNGSTCLKEPPYTFGAFIKPITQKINKS